MSRPSDTIKRPNRAIKELAEATEWEPWMGDDGKREYRHNAQIVAYIEHL